MLHLEINVQAMFDGICKCEVHKDGGQSESKNRGTNSAPGPSLWAPLASKYNLQVLYNY